MGFNRRSRIFRVDEIASMSRSELDFAFGLLEKLDSMPFKAVNCMGDRHCKNPVTKMTLYKGQYNSDYWFCDSCNPYRLGAVDGALMPISSASRIIGHSQADSIIKAMFLAKGGPQKKTPAALKNFFSY